MIKKTSISTYKLGKRQTCLNNKEIVKLICTRSRVNDSFLSCGSKKFLIKVFNAPLSDFPLFNCQSMAIISPKTNLSSQILINKTFIDTHYKGPG